MCEFLLDGCNKKSQHCIQFIDTSFSWHRSLQFLLPRKYLLIKLWMTWIWHEVCIHLSFSLFLIQQQQKNLNILFLFIFFSSYLFWLCIWPYLILSPRWTYLVAILNAMSVNKINTIASIITCFSVYLVFLCIL